MSYTYVLSDESVALVNLTNGNKVTIFKDDPRYDEFKRNIVRGAYEAAEEMDVKVVVQKFGMASASGNFGVVIVDGEGKVQVNGTEYPLADAIVDRILKMNAEGFTPLPLINFLENLYQNPSKTAIEELFLFQQASDLPITEDGYLVAYKIVSKLPNGNLVDCYTKKLNNNVGEVVKMPRFEVDDERTNLCSSGLHFCSKGYLPHYGTGGGEVCVLVKINPKDVVSIPSDYNNAKGRCCEYKVLALVQDENWRQNLSEKDYNTKTVVSKVGEEISSTQHKSQIGISNKYRYDTGMRRWRDLSNGQIVSREDIIYSNVNLTFQDVINAER